MPIAKFQMPDGRIARFEVPEGTTPEQANTMMQAHFEQPAQDAPQAPAQATKQADRPMMDKLQGSAAGGVIQGARDPIDQAAAMLPKGLQAITSLAGNYPNQVSEFFGDEAARVQGINQQNEEEYQQARAGSGREGFDASRLAGAIVSPANIAVAAKIPSALRGVQAIKSGVASGAVGGALAGGDVTQEDYWKQKMLDTAKGAALGFGLGTTTAGVARVIRPNTNASAQKLIDAGVTPTPGQILGGTAQRIEDKLTSVPILGDAIAHGQKTAIADFNRAALARALAPIGETADDIGRAGVGQVRQKLSAAYDDLLPKLKFVPDNQFVSELTNLRQMAQGLGAKESSKFNSVLEDALSKVSPNGGMQGETFKIVESKLATEAKKFSGSTDAYQKELGDALNEALRIFRDTLPRTNPQYADRLKKINEGWANYARIRQAASSTAAGANDGVFSPAQLAMAVKALDKSAGKGASAEGRALMQDLAEAGTRTLSSKVPDSGTAGRLGLGMGAGGLGIGLTSLPTTAGIAGGLGLGSLMYLGAGKKMAAAALTQRPDFAQRLAELVRQGSPYVAGGAALETLK